jgi:23S rRNA (uridine2552-2'-O)-methyltransferase
VLDLGAAPGSWAQYAAPKIGPRGFLLAIDRNEIKASLPDNASVVRGDVLAAETIESLVAHGPFDVVLSDMAPSTSGVRFVDHQRSLELARAALAIAERALRPGGAAFVKVFDGEDLPAFRKEFAARFEKTSVEKPDASRKDSVELFLLGKGFRGAVRL